MLAAPLPQNEHARLAALQSYEILDTLCESAFDNIAALAALLTKSPVSAVSLVDAQRQWFKAQVGLDVLETDREISFCAHAILTPDEPLIVPDARDDPRFCDNPLVTGDFGLRFYAGVPLLSRERAALGTLCVIDKEPRQLTAEQRISLQRLAEAVMTTLELRRVTSKLHRAAHIDFLTGLPNRAALFDALERAIAKQERHGGNLSLLLLDLDGFKAINDTFGHAQGDATLKNVADALNKVMRAEDFVARLGGDEFAVLIAGDDLCANRAARRLLAEIGRIVDTRGGALASSIGHAHFAMPPESAERALACADGAMYVAKAAGGNRISYAQVDELTVADQLSYYRPTFSTSKVLAEDTLTGT